MNLTGFAQLLQDKGCGDLGRTIFVIEMPSSCMEGILLMGSYSGAPINQYLPDYYDAEFRVVVRSVDYERGYALARKASIALKTMGDGYMLGDTMMIKQCYPMNLPRPYRRSVGGYWEFEIDMASVYYDPAA